MENGRFRQASITTVTTITKPANSSTNHKLGCRAGRKNRPKYRPSATARQRITSQQLVGGYFVRHNHFLEEIGD